LRILVGKKLHEDPGYVTLAGRTENDLCTRHQM